MHSHLNYGAILIAAASQFGLGGLVQDSFRTVEEG